MNRAHNYGTYVTVDRNGNAVAWDTECEARARARATDTHVYWAEYTPLDTDVDAQSGSTVLQLP